MKKVVECESQVIEMRANVNFKYCVSKVVIRIARAVDNSAQVKIRVDISCCVTTDVKCDVCNVNLRFTESGRWNSQQGSHRLV